MILVRQETSPEDLRGMSVAKGILTARGGMTSHAAVVARGMGKCCVSGAGAVHVDLQGAHDDRRATRLRRRRLDLARTAPPVRSMRARLPPRMPNSAATLAR